MKQILFPNDAEFWYETQRSFGQIAYGGGDFGEVLVISEQITEGDYGSWYDDVPGRCGPDRGGGG
jgi:hypothetical protein